MSDRAGGRRRRTRTPDRLSKRLAEVRESVRESAAARDEGDSPDEDVPDREEILATPQAFAEACMNFPLETPDHLKNDIYGPAYRAVAGDEDAPRHICRLMPREHGKSEAASVVLPTWLALRDHNVRILLMSKTLDQAKGKLREVRGHIERLAGTPPFEDVRITESNKTGITLERSESHDVPTVKAAGFRSGVTGGHFDYLSFDDVVDWENQRTPARRDKIWKQFQDYLNLGSGGETAYVVVGTRKHPEDLYSQLLAGPAWDSNVRRAVEDWSIVENNEYTLVTDAGTRYAAENIGDLNPREETVVRVEPHREVPVLWPERWDLPSLLLDLVTGYGSEQGSLVWLRENLNMADVFEGEILSADMLTFNDGLPVDRDECTWYAGLDPAVEEDPEKAATNDTDYWGLAFGAYDPEGGVTYVDRVVRKRGMSMNQGLQWVKRHAADYADVGLEEILVEGQQAQRWLVQNGKDEDLPMEMETSSGSKKKRIIDMSSRFENGKAQLVDSDERSESWESFVNEWCAFPSGRFDDRLDAVEILLRAVDESATAGERGFKMYTIEDDRGSSVRSSGGGFRTSGSSSGISF